MASKNKKTRADKALKPNHTHGADVGVLAGELVGGIVGSLAGPPGAVAGMVFGAIAGNLAGGVIDGEAERAHIHDDDLDEAIGVTSSELGAPNLRHPPASTGANYAASTAAAKVGAPPLPRKPTRRRA